MNKIVILSTNGEKSTNRVIDWLQFYGADFIRINETDHLQLDFLEFDTKKGWDFIIMVNNHTAIKFSEIKSYWYRRGNLNFNSFISNSLLSGSVKADADELVSFIHHKFKTKKHINSYFDNYINKNIVLDLAQEVGLTIPPTIITTRKSRAMDFYEKNENIVSKNIKQFMYQINTDLTVYSPTIAIHRDDFMEMDDSFGFSLFQKNIIKKFEVRSFFMDGVFYSMAIFSQGDEKTQTDFRNYNIENPNRNVPFKLPSTIEKKLLKLFSALNINCGSADLIFSTDNKYYFLEINPIGQFDPLVNNCNYPLEKMIATYLIA